MKRRLNILREQHLLYHNQPEREGILRHYIRATAMYLRKT